MRSMNRFIHLLAAVLFLHLATAWAADATPTSADPALEERVNRLSAELRCLVCQNQSLADSHADLAIDLKNQVREQLRTGRSEQDVIRYMTERYGDFVLYRPPLKATTVLLWAGPLLFLLLGAGVAWRHLAQSRKQAPEPPLDLLSAQRAAELLESGSSPPRDA